MTIDSDAVHEAIARTLRAERARRAETQTEVGHASGLSRSLIANVELGRRTVSVADLYAIADALDVPVSTFTDAIAEALRD